MSDVENVNIASGEGATAAGGDVATGGSTQATGEGQAAAATEESAAATEGATATPGIAKTKANVAVGGGSALLLVIAIVLFAAGVTEFGVAALAVAAIGGAIQAYRLAKGL